MKRLSCNSTVACYVSKAWTTNILKTNSFFRFEFSLESAAEREKPQRKKLQQETWRSGWWLTHFPILSFHFLLINPIYYRVSSPFRVPMPSTVVTELKKELQRLVMAILDEDDYSLESIDEALTILNAFNGLKLKNSSDWLNLAEVVNVIPKEFKCPLSGDLMSDPVVLSSGQVFHSLFLRSLILLLFLFLFVRLQSRNLILGVRVLFEVLWFSVANFQKGFSARFMFLIDS